jgi:hypothetical protein
MLKVVSKLQTEQIKRLTLVLFIAALLGTFLLGTAFAQRKNAYLVKVGEKEAGIVKEEQVANEVFETAKSFW